MGIDIAQTVFVLLHIAGLAGLVAAGVLALMGKAGAKAAAFHSALLQLVSGLVLVGLMYAAEEEPNNTKLGVKLLVLLAIIGLAAANRRKPEINKTAYVVIAVLAIVNATIAWVWV